MKTPEELAESFTSETCGRNFRRDEPGGPSCFNSIDIYRAFLAGYKAGQEEINLLKGLGQQALGEIWQARGEFTEAEADLWEEVKP